MASMYLARSSDHVSIIVVIRHHFFMRSLYREPRCPLEILYAIFNIYQTGGAAAFLKENKGPVASIGMTIMWTLDLLMLAMGIALFTAGMAYVAACDRL